MPDCSALENAYELAQATADYWEALFEYLTNAAAAAYPEMLASAESACNAYEDWQSCQNGGAELDRAAMESTRPRHPTLDQLNQRMLKAKMWMEELKASTK